MNTEVELLVEAADRLRAKWATASYYLEMRASELAILRLKESHPEPEGLRDAVLGAAGPRT